jgi:hypothetical protein
MAPSSWSASGGQPVDTGRRLNRVRGPDAIDVPAPSGSGGIRIGALVRYSTLEFSSRVAERLPLLARALPYVGDRQIRNRGTLGGALCSTSPYRAAPECWQVQPYDDEQPADHTGHHRLDV